MAYVVILLIVFAAAGLGGGAVLWLAFNRKKTSQNRTSSTGNSPSEERATGLPFRWRYVLLPLLVLLVSVIAIAYFYRLLPSEVSFSLGASSTAKLIGRDLFVAMMAAPQFLLAMAGATVAHLIARVANRYVQDGSAPAPPFESIMTIMSNMVVLPQLVLCYAMFDVFVSNVYEVRLPAIYLFGILVMVLGGAILGFFFLKAFQQTRGLRSRRA